MTESEKAPSGDGTSGTNGIEPHASLAEPCVPHVPHVPLDRKGDRVNPLLDTADMERIASATLSDVIEVEKQCLALKDDFDYWGMNIGLALSYIQELLPESSRIFYIGFRGPRGSGKTTATTFCSRIAYKGRKIEGVTFASLAAACDDGETLCIDEFDAQNARCSDLETIVRQGVSLDAIYSKMAPDQKGRWRRCELKIGGVKFLNWKDPIDDALQQRILVIDMVPNASTRMIVNNEAMERFTSPLRIWFAAQSAGVRQRWTKEQVANLIDDRDNHLTNKVDAIASIVPRQKQKAFWMFVVSELYGWDIDEIIRKLIEKQPEAEDYSDHIELVREIYYQQRELLDNKGAKDRPVEIELVEFKRDLTERITTKHLEPLRKRGKPGTLTWTGLRQECGFVEGTNERKDSRRHGKRILVFDEQVQKAIGVLDGHKMLDDGGGA